MFTDQTETTKNPWQNAWQKLLQNPTSFCQPQQAEESDEDVCSSVNENSDKHDTKIDVDTSMNMDDNTCAQSVTSQSTLAQVFGEIQQELYVATEQARSRQVFQYMTDTTHDNDEDDNEDNDDDDDLFLDTPQKKRVVNVEQRRVSDIVFREKNNDTQHDPDQSDKLDSNEEVIRPSESTISEGTCQTEAFTPKEAPPSPLQGRETEGEKTRTMLMSSQSCNGSTGWKFFLVIIGLAALIGGGSFFLASKHNITSLEQMKIAMNNQHVVCRKFWNGQLNTTCFIEPAFTSISEKSRNVNEQRELLLAQYKAAAIQKITETERLLLRFVDRASDTAHFHQVQSFVSDIISTGKIQIENLAKAQQLSTKWSATQNFFQRILMKGRDYSFQKVSPYWNLLQSYEAKLSSRHRLQRLACENYIFSDDVNTDCILEKVATVMRTHQVWLQNQVELVITTLYQQINACQPYWQLPLETLDSQAVCIFQMDWQSHYKTHREIWHNNLQSALHTSKLQITACEGVLFQGRRNTDCALEQWFFQEGPTEKEETITVIQQNTRNEKEDNADDDDGAAADEEEEEAETDVDIDSQDKNVEEISVEIEDTNSAEFIEDEEDFIMNESNVEDDIVEDSSMATNIDKVLLEEEEEEIEDLSLSRHEAIRRKDEEDRRKFAETYFDDLEPVSIDVLEETPQEEEEDVPNTKIDPVLNMPESRDDTSEAMQENSMTSDTVFPIDTAEETQQDTVEENEGSEQDESFENSEVQAPQEDDISVGKVNVEDEVDRMVKDKKCFTRRCHARQALLEREEAEKKTTFEFVSIEYGTESEPRMVRSSKKLQNIYSM